jgi:transcriptional regulator GlxA family with amidase domain
MSRSADVTEAKYIAILLLPDAQLLDIAGPSDVFSAANHLMDTIGVSVSDTYRVVLLSGTSSLEMMTSGGIALTCGCTVHDINFEIDTLLIAGSNLEVLDQVDGFLYQWLNEIAPDVRRIGSICIGAFVLAKAGLLARKQVTTHWKYAGILKKMYPELEVDVNPFYIRDGNLYSSGGVTAGMDLALALIEEDYGRELAATVARHLVLPLKRLGAQSQFGTGLLDYEPLTPFIKDVRNYIAHHLHQSLTIQEIAGEVHMSERNFSRVFQKEAGMTIGRFVEAMRLELAKNLLECSDLTLEHIAQKCGFKHVSSLQRLFLKALELSPSNYRKAFKTTSPG